MSDDREVIVNLWYVRDREGLIYSLRAKAYVAIGSEEEKLKFLQERACLDYLIAEPFEVPRRFHVHVAGIGESAHLPVGHVAMLETLDSPIALFEDALREIENRFPAQSRLKIPANPLVCTTPLMADEDGNIEPRFSGRRRL